jgi:hypothetical protein
MLTPPKPDGKRDLPLVLAIGLGPVIEKAFQSKIQNEIPPTNLAQDVAYRNLTIKYST